VERGKVGAFKVIVIKSRLKVCRCVLF